MIHSQRAKNPRLPVPATVVLLPIICLVATLALWVVHITMCEEMLTSLRCFKSLLVCQIRDLLLSPIYYTNLCAYYIFNQDLRYSIEISLRVPVMTPERASLPQDAIHPPVKPSLLR